jgi:hypothetical protein
MIPNFNDICSVFITEKVCFMKKYISLYATMAIMMVIGFGCKVGVDDPASLASRDGRVIATWNLTAVVDSAIATNSFGTFVSTKSYNGTILTETDVFGTSTVSYSLQLIIDKDGLLTVTETSDGDITVENNYWEWLGADRNKSQLLLNTNSMAAGIWVVRRLAGDELVLEQYTKEVDTNNGTTDTQEETIRLTFAAE